MLRSVRPTTKSDMIQAIQDHIRDNGGIRTGYGWYAGVTSAPNDGCSASTK